MSDAVFVPIFWTWAIGLVLALVLHIVGRDIERSSHTWLWPEDEPDPEKRAIFDRRMEDRRSLGNRLMMISAWIYIPFLGIPFLVGLGLAGSLH